MRQAISVMKKRGGEHERTIREFRLGRRPASTSASRCGNFRGILTGVPVLRRRRGAPADEDAAP